MTSLEKFKRLIELENKKLRVTTSDGKVYRCVAESPAEGEEDWAYNFISPDYPTKYFILECNFIEHIEEISQEEWTRHPHAN